MRPAGGLVTTTIRPSLVAVRLCGPAGTGIRASTFPRPTSTTATRPSPSRATYASVRTAAPAEPPPAAISATAARISPRSTSPPRAGRPASGTAPRRSRPRGGALPAVRTKTHWSALAHDEQPTLVGRPGEVAASAVADEDPPGRPRPPRIEEGDLGLTARGAPSQDEALRARGDHERMAAAPEGKRRARPSPAGRTATRSSRSRSGSAHRTSTRSVSGGRRRPRQRPAGVGSTT